MPQETPPKPQSDLALFLDFDGTLVDLAATPDAIVVPARLRPLLARLADRLDGAVALVSGRTLAEIARFLAPLELPGAGSHGLERRRADGTLVQPGAEIGAAAADILAEVRARLGDVPGLLFEAKAWTAAVHFRGAPERGPSCIAAMQAVVAGHPGWEAVPGKMVIEARPVSVSKADALRAFMAEPPFAGRVPVFIGDDVTDEDGIRAAMALGGFGIKVGDGESQARYRLASPADVLGYLEQVAG